ncbi:N-acetylmuramoyl-L-alanine amidase family protein [Clostridium butyricum]|uniref:N-acetylmuramoyl-L-alanine amidase family protein n=1 Tax=Clostridium butyricum TaxID=1492 RepID=UPI00374E4768
MFKRSSKMTALLVAAAAVVSIVPASASERLGTKDGTITNARAYDGGYVYDGYRTDDDDSALYYNNGSKDINTDENEDYDTYSLDRYGDKYATVKDDGDDYLLDLSNGKIDDEETLSDKLDNAKNKLKSKINKEDRYIGFKNSDFITNKDEIATNKNSFKRILSDKYGEVWYQYSAKGDSDAIDRTTGAAVEGEGKDAVGYYQGFSNDSGKYIDVTQDCNIYAYDTDKNKTVKIEEYGKTYSTNNLKARLDSVTPISQDKDNLYVFAKVVITGDHQIAPETTQYYLQKISKSQGDKKDGAYLPKDTTSYQLNVEMAEYLDGDKKLRIYDDGDSSDAADVIKSYVDYLNGKETEFDGRVCENIEVKDGVLYATTVKTDNVKMFKIKLKKDKLDITEKVDQQVDDKENTSKIENVDAYTVKKDGDGDHDTVDVVTDKDGKNYSIDIDGNTWILDKGKILKADGTDFKEVYTVDRSIDKLDVYDENNLIAWSSDGDVYTTVAEGKKQTDEDAGVDEDKKDETTVVKAGWDKNADGTWAFYKDGAKATGWLNDKGTWYYLDAAGTMKTGWVQAGAWYYLNASGAMQTGWVNDNGTWYYCNASGAMQTGWLLDGSTWYYLNANGSMAANTTVDGYVLGANGAML